MKQVATIMQKDVIGFTAAVAELKSCKLLKYGNMFLIP